MRTAKSSMHAVHGWLLLLPAMTLLFAFTARAFGRRALIADLVIGFVLSTLIFLMFNKLLQLALPMGPLERLF